ncbi:Hypp9012 [Branchiostoma lanceolatum]|uniref:Hypp9012 protein n=1 Tax=Branchiostoma lanceolatum TaxID=7740 RepID=A0A8K0EJK4_BRALA|nr:Hypp9012 [Branchiostoma lanceolatum]
MMERVSSVGRTSSTKTEPSGSAGRGRTATNHAATKRTFPKQDWAQQELRNVEGGATKNSTALKRASTNTEVSWTLSGERNGRNLTVTEETDSLKEGLARESPNGDGRTRKNSAESISKRTGSPRCNESVREIIKGGGTGTRSSTGVKRAVSPATGKNEGLRELCHTGGRTTRNSTAVRADSPSHGESLRDVTEGGTSWKEYLPVIFLLYEMHLSPSFRPAAVPPPPRKHSTEHGYKLLRFLDDEFRNERIRRSSFQPAEEAVLPVPNARVPNRRWSMAVPSAGQLVTHGDHESQVPDTGPGYLITPALLSRLQRLHRSTSRGMGGGGGRRLSTLSSVSGESESERSGVETDNEKSRRSSVKESGASSFESRRQSVSSSLVGTVSRRPSVTSSLLGTPSRRGSVVGPTVLGSHSRRGSLAGPTGMGPLPRRGSLVGPTVNGSVSRRGSLVRYALYEEPYLNPVDAASTENTAKIPPVPLPNRPGSSGSKTSSGSDSGTRLQDSIISATSGSTDKLQPLLAKRKSGFGPTEQVQTLDVGVSSGFNPEAVAKVPISLLQNARTGRVMTKLSMGPPTRRSRRASLFY